VKPADALRRVELKGRVAATLRKIGCDIDVQVNGLELVDELLAHGTDPAIVLRLVVDLVQNKPAMDARTAARTQREDEERRSRTSAASRNAETGRLPATVADRWDLNTEG
jgi:hypothetical protein